VARIYCTYFPIQAAISCCMDACGQAPLIVPKMQDLILVPLCWRSFSGCGWAREYASFAHQGGKYVGNEACSTNINILQFTVAYLNATINVKPKTQSQRLETTGLAKPGETRGLTGTGPGLARQHSAGRVIGRVWNRTDQVYRSKPGPLAGYPDTLLTLIVGMYEIKYNKVGQEMKGDRLAEMERLSIFGWCSTLDMR
jgi:hypothetical protein